MERMNPTPVVLAAAVGGLITHAKKKSVWEGVLWGGGSALAVALLLGHKYVPGHWTGQLPSQLEPALPGQMTYNLDPRTDPRLDPVSRRSLYPAWLLAHWQNGDRRIIAQIQRQLGVAGDGIPGGSTSVAIHAFQAQNGLQTTGEMDIRTMQALTSG